MNILSHILYWSAISCIAIIVVIFGTSFLMSVTSGLGVWLDYRRALKNGTAEKVEKPKRGFFGTIKDTLTIFLWAFLFAIIATASAFMTLCLYICEGLEYLCDKIRGKETNSENYWW